MDSVRITDARRRFLKSFDDYTQGGMSPQELTDLWRKFDIQPRVINYCRRQGLIKQVKAPAAYVVTAEAKRLAKIVEETMESTENTLNSLVRRRVRKRSSALNIKKV